MERLTGVATVTNGDGAQKVVNLSQTNIKIYEAQKALRSS